MEFLCVWPINDDSRTLTQLAAEAWPEMVLRAAEAGATIVGKPRWSVGTRENGRSTLVGRAPAQNLPAPMVKPTEPARVPAGDLAPVACGTEKGYQRHRYLREPKCSPCLAAHAEVQRERAAGKRGAA